MLRLLLLVGCWLAIGSGSGPVPWRTPALNSDDRVRMRIEALWRRSRPVRRASDAVNVTLGLSDFNLADYQDMQYQTVSGWLMVKWIDYRLAWNDRATLADVHKVRVMLGSSRAWTPSIQVLNSGVKTSSLFPPVTECVVSRNGEVLAMLPVQFKVQCKMVFGSKTIQYVGSAEKRRAIICPITFGSLLTSLDLVNLQLMNGTSFSDTESSINFSSWKATAERKEVVRGCCSEPFVVLETLLVFY